MLRDAPILLLDEPTTGLDPLSAEAVLAAWETLSHRRTTVVIAHQLTTVLRADRIVFLECGRIVGSGTHEALLKQNERYAEFFRAEWGSLAARAGRATEAHP